MICLFISIECSEKILYQILSPETTKVYATTQIHYRVQAANETLLVYIQRFTDLVIHATGAHPTSVMCQVTIIPFIRHLFNKEIKKQVAGTKNIQTLCFGYPQGQ